MDQDIEVVWWQLFESMGETRSLAEVREWVTKWPPRWASMMTRRTRIGRSPTTSPKAVAPMSHEPGDPDKPDGTHSK